MKLYAVYIMRANGFWHLSSFRLGRNPRHILRQFPQCNNKHTLICIAPKGDLGTGTQLSAPVFSDEQPPSDPSPAPSVSEDKQEVIMLTPAKLELIMKLAEFLIDGYLDADPSEGVQTFETAVGFTVPADVKQEAFGVYYAYAASEYAQQKNF
jgi:hypothetical protein